MCARFNDLIGNDPDSRGECDGRLEFARSLAQDHRVKPLHAMTRRFALGLFLATVLLVPRISPAAEDAAVTVIQDVPYKAGDALDDYEKERCKLDLYQPAGRDGLPCLVWLHGGGLTGGGKTLGGTVPVCRALASEGFLVVAVNYRLSPRAKFPAYVEDSAAAVAWTMQHAAQYGGNPRRIYVAGHSAGGYLAAMVAMAPNYLAKDGVSPNQLAGIIPVAGQMVTHYTIREERGMPKTRIIIDEAAPLYHARADTPPLLLLYAEKDMALRGEENRYFAAALEVAGNRRVTLQEIAGHDHGGIGDRISEPASPVRKLIVDFIRQTGEAGAAK